MASVPMVEGTSPKSTIDRGDNAREALQQGSNPVLTQGTEADGADQQPKVANKQQPNGLGTSHPAPKPKDQSTGELKKSISEKSSNATEGMEKEGNNETSLQSNVGLAKKMLDNPRIRLPIAVTAAVVPLLLMGMLYISSLSFKSQFIVGITLGFTAMFSFQLISCYRSDLRMHKVVSVAQMSQLNANALRILLPNSESFPRWAVFTDFEKMEWLNREINKMWVVLEEAASKMIMDTLQPVLDQYAVGVIHKLIIKTVKLGVRAPRVLGIRVTEGDEDECVLEVHIGWETEKESLVFKVNTTGPDFKVAVKNWRVNGVGKVVFKPLTPQIPGFGAILASMSEPPELGFDLKFLGGDINALPGVEKMIDNSIRTALMDILVWPNRIVIPMMPGDFSFLELHPVGELEVSLIEGKDIKNTDIVGKTDPFVIMFVREKQDVMKRSTVKKNSLKPVWNETFNIVVEDAETQKLTFRLMDDETLEKSEYIGACLVPIAELIPNSPTEMWRDVYEDPNSPVPSQHLGKLHFIVTYKPYNLEKETGQKGSNETEHKISNER